MSPRTRLVLSVSSLLLIGGPLAYYFTRGSAPASSPASAGGAPAAKSTVPAPAAGVPVAPAAPAGPVAKAERDPVAVFQRAFWRRPASDDRIVHAERVEWVEGADKVDRWSWFVVVEPGDAFRTWLLQENPFSLAPVAGAVPARSAAAPAWFPSDAELARCTQYRARGGGLTVFVDPAKNRFYATDSGRGFAPPAR